MAKDRSEEKKALYEKVLGKNAPDRSLTKEDLAVLKTNPFTGEDISDELKALQANYERIKQQTNSLSEQIYSDNMIDLDSLRASIKQDFGADFPVEQESTINLVSDQENLDARFGEIETILNQSIFNQSDYLRSLCKAFKRPFIMGQQPSGLACSLLITGQPYTGRHQSVNEIVKLLVQANLLTTEHISTISLEKYASKEDENNFIIDLYGAISNSQVIVFDQIDAIAPSYLNYIEQILLEGKLSLSKRYVLKEKQLVETNNALVKNSISEISFKGKYLIFITSLKTSKLLNVVGSRFVNHLSDSLRTDALTEEDIVEIYPNKLVGFATKCLTNLNINIVSDPSMTNYILDTYALENVEFLERLFHQLYTGLSEYKLVHSFNQTKTITVSYHENQLYIDQQPLQQYLPEVIDNAKDEVQKELDNIVGLQKIKDYIMSLQDFYAAQKKRQQAGFSATEVSKHMIFTGNPGTGKTTIARLLAKYLKSIGVLSNGQLIEVSRNDLVGKYVGHTAPLTMQVIKSAIGGVLFIDEAYSLYRGSNDSFGLECIDTLVKAMEDYRDNLIVILAGYSREMEEFLESNSGLKSRFPNVVEFPDYTGEELFQIAKINAKSAGYRFDQDVQQPLTDYFTKVQQNDSVRSGNGRLSRNTVEEAVRYQATRTLKQENAPLDLLTLEDFLPIIQRLENSSQNEI